VIKAKYAAIEQAKLDKVEEEKQRVVRKQNRRQAREIRAKDLELDKFRDQIQRNVIFKGEVVEVVKNNLIEMHGFYGKENFLGSLGGQIQQIYYIIEEIIKKYPQGLKNYMQKKVENNDEDYFSRPNNLRELMLTEHLLPFLMMYLNKMTNESIDLFLHPLCVKYLDDLDCPYDDLSGLDGDQLVEFKELFMANRSQAHRTLSKQIDTLLDFCIDILAKRAP